MKLRIIDARVSGSERGRRSPIRAVPRQREGRKAPDGGASIQFSVAPRRC